MKPLIPILTVALLTTGLRAQAQGTAFPYQGRLATVNAEDVALAALQGLNQKLEEHRAESAELKRRLETLERLFTQQIIHH